MVAMASTTKAPDDRRPQQPKALSYFAKDPLEQILRKKRRLQWRTEDEHWSRPVLERSTGTGEIRCRIIYDGRWACSKCRPSKAWREGSRILRAFGYEWSGPIFGWEHTGSPRHHMWLSLVSKADGDRAARWLRDHHIQYVAVPTTFDYAILTTSPVGSVSDLVDDPPDFIMERLMPYRWTGSLRSSRKFLPPAREHVLFEAHHPSTGRRCWHHHPSRDEAELCAEETGMKLDGTTSGWYVRGCSPYRQVGSISVNGDELRTILDRLHIKHWYHERYPNQEEKELHIEPMEWDDERFAEFRSRAGWKAPYNGWEPPPLRISITVAPDGAMTA